ncbi:MAG: arylsulfatase A-like enzyme [Planctomycetota bacterium]|jgi:arylsulfatase A-like enzyme
MKISLIALLIGIGPLSSCGSPESRAADLKSALAGSNVVLISVDSFAAGHTTPYGYERDTTPALSKLAEESIRFADVSTGSSNGFASVSSLFRGEAVEFCEARRPGEITPAGASDLASAFKRAGYRVLGLSTHPGFQSALGKQRGFDSLEFVAETRADGVPEAAHVLFDQYLKTSSSAPFFIYVQLGNARAPRAPHPERAQALLGELPDDEAGQLAFLNGMKSARAAPNRTLMAIDLYDAVLYDIDYSIARFSDSLKRTGRDRDTLLIVAGTCGQAFGQRGYFGVGQDVYQEQIAVPLLMRMPAARSAGLVVHDPVALYDLFPTLADLYELDVPPSHSGSALTLLLTEDWHEREWPVSASTVNLKHQSSMRMGHFKLIDFSQRKGAASAQLLNLERDKLETSDHGPQRPETKSELQRELLRFRDAAKRVRGEPASITLSPELISELQTLGYTQ